MTIDQVLNKVASYDTEHVTVTGGEPLSQSHCRQLLTSLCDTGYQVSLETSGAIDVADVDVRVMKVVDLKTPGSAEMHRNLYSNLDHLNGSDQVKFVLCGREDYDWAKSCIDEYSLQERCEVLFSPSFTELDATDLADWILADRLKVRMQMQLHKILWNDEPGR